MWPQCIAVSSCLQSHAKSAWWKVSHRVALSWQGFWPHITFQFLIRQTNVVLGYWYSPQASNHDQEVKHQFLVSLQCNVTFSPLLSCAWVCHTGVALHPLPSLQMTFQFLDQTCLFGYPDCSINSETYQGDTVQGLQITKGQVAIFYFHRTTMVHLVKCHAVYRGDTQSCSPNAGTFASLLPLSFSIAPSCSVAMSVQLTQTYNAAPCWIRWYSPQASDHDRRSNSTLVPGTMQWSFASNNTTPYTYKFVANFSHSFSTEGCSCLLI